MYIVGKHAPSQRTVAAIGCRAIIALRDGYISVVVL